MKSVLLALLATQFALIPAFALSLWATPRRVGLRFAWGMHRALVVAVVLAPLAGLMPAGVMRADLGAASENVAAAVAALAPTGTELRAAAPTPVLRPIPASVASTLAAVLGALSAVGAAALAASLVAERLRERGLRLTGRVRRFGRLEIVASPLVAMPFSTGVLSPRVYLPVSPEPGIAELRMVLAHEGTHLRRAHHGWTMVEACLAALFWYNPLLVAQCARGRLIRELFCDAAAARLHSPEEYGRFLTRAAERALSAHRHLRFADCWLGRGALAARIRFLLEGGPRKSRAGVWLMATAAGVLAGALLLTAVSCLTPAAGGSPEPRRETFAADASGVRFGVVSVGLGSIRGNTSDLQAGVWVADVVLGWPTGDKATAAEIERRSGPVKDAIMVALAHKTYDQLLSDRLPGVEEKLVAVVNDVLTEGKVELVMLRNFTVVR